MVVKHLEPNGVVMPKGLTLQSPGLDGLSKLTQNGYMLPTFSSAYTGRIVYAKKWHRHNNKIKWKQKKKQTNICDWSYSVQIIVKHEVDGPLPENLNLSALTLSYLIHMKKNFQSFYFNIYKTINMEYNSSAAGWWQVIT